MPTTRREKSRSLQEAAQLVADEMTLTEEGFQEAHPVLAAERGEFAVEDLDSSDGATRTEKKRVRPTRKRPRSSPRRRSRQVCVRVRDAVRGRVQRLGAAAGLRWNERSTYVAQLRDVSACHLARVPTSGAG